MTTAWPTTSDFLAVVPGGFRGALVGATIERGMFDQPVVVSGQRAIVLPVHLAGERRAVRFSLTDPTGNLPRYEAINEALRTNPGLPLVNTIWEPAGVEIRGQLYPVMIMDWVDAQPLADVVDDMIGAGDLDGVASLTARISGVFHELEAAGLVHGDIQHGNLLVSESAVTLVDYDSVFAPGMPSSTGATEAGHPNYRHPGAAQLPGGRPNGDTFAATLIIASLNWISARPELWRYHHGENLILDAADLENPETSEAWREIDSIGLATSNAYADRIRGLLAMAPSDLPPFSEAIALDRPLEVPDATREAEETRVPDVLGDETVISTAAARDRATIPTDHDDKPTVGQSSVAGVPPPGTPPTPPLPMNHPPRRVSSSRIPAQPDGPATSSIPTVPIAAVPPPGQAPAYEPTGATELRSATPGENHGQAEEPHKHKGVIATVAIAVGLLIGVGAASAWVAFGSGDDTDEGPRRVVKVDQDRSGADDDSTEGQQDKPATTDSDGGSSTSATTEPPTISRPPTTGHGDCDVITSTLALQWLEAPPRCLDYTASGPLATSTIPEGWFVALASAVMTDPNAEATSQSQLDHYRGIFPDAVRVDSRLYRGMRDPVWAVVLPVSSESAALGYCSYPELADVDGCTARHTELTLDELQAGQRP